MDGELGLQKGGPNLTMNLLLVSVPYGILTALVAKAIIGKSP